MAEDARISTSLPSHPKTRKLKKRLGAGACWSLVCLYLWVADNRSDGNLHGLSDEDLEIVAEWEGDPGAFVATLTELRFIDGEPGRYAIHDWAEWNPWAASRGQRVEAAKRAAAVRWNARGEHGESGADAHRNADRCAPHETAMPTTQPNHSQPNLKTSTSETGVSDEKSSRRREPSREAQRLSEHLKCRILQNKPDYRITPGHLRNWVTTADRMLRIDGRTEEQVRSLIDWVQSDEFWRANVLSMEKLREKFDQLELKRAVVLPHREPSKTGWEAAAQ